jgi:thiamine-phosphate pyrophosphorylase
MHRKLQTPIIYLITNGETNLQTTPASQDFLQILKLIESAVSAGIDLVQIREKNLNSRVLFQLASSASQISERSNTRVLVNDRADIAAAAGADGVHLTTRSLPPEVVRQTFGGELLIGVSTHSLAEAAVARKQSADFVVFGPVFETPGKNLYGEAAGLPALKRVTEALAGFPVLALGGVNVERSRASFEAGAQGVAAIRMFNDPAELKQTVAAIRRNFSQYARF